VSTNPRGGPPKTPQRRQGSGLRPTKPATLIVAALAAAAVGWLFIANDYSDFPTIQWLPTIIFTGLAALEFIAATSTKARIDRKAGSGPIEPLTVMRYAVLAKASSLAAAIFGGFFAAVLAWLLGSRGSLVQAADDTPPAIGAVVGAVLLLIAALLLERACRVPPQPEDEDEEDDEASH
jgi:hypothetical protein